ncbi:single-stranded DNA-binding protein [Lacibacter luteus]|uniref:Single-stranded DNA-binding protein n=1 Tax=Lacibacter luteus TaxID=2508719 RepID=A0A4Q1CFH7_9BACT|nr:single-stranded DNA-binding protein [Lacibacter luteus]RXK58549.1 single-stranded DNA-binding protein [Lacibacter luteus]
MIIIGRLTKNGLINTLKDERKVLNFTVAVNDYYKPKGADKAATITTYYNCSYWINMQLAERLTKGTLVELDGRIGVNAYTTMQGEAKASLILHVNAIKIHQTMKNNVAASIPKKEEVSEDLPF